MTKQVPSKKTPIQQPVPQPAQTSSPQENTFGISYLFSFLPSLTPCSPVSKPTLQKQRSDDSSSFEPSLVLTPTAAPSSTSHDSTTGSLPPESKNVGSPSSNATLSNLRHRALRPTPAFDPEDEAQPLLSSSSS